MSIPAETPADKDSSSGIGLQNVQRRLDLLYPEVHKLELKRTEEWFEVELWVLFGHWGH